MLALAAALGLAKARADDLGDNLEALVGRVAAELLAEEFGTLDNPFLQNWVERVGARVAGHCPRQEFPFTFRILDCAEANAYALPGAHIFVTRGLLAQVKSDDELAGVLAHEVGHIADRDFQRLVARQLMFLGIREGLSRTDLDSLAPALYIVQLLNTLRHSRRQEDQADLRAVEYTLRARYDPTAITAFYDLILGGRTTPREWYEGLLQTHPDAYRRRQRCMERTSRLAQSSPDALDSVIQDLRGRYRYSAALRLSQVARLARPGDLGPLLVEAQIRLERGEREACLRACDEGLRISPEDASFRNIAAQANQLDSESSQSRSIAKTSVALRVDLAALRRLKQSARTLAADRQLSEAVTWAQAYQPEIRDWRWVYLLLQVQMLLQIADRLRWRLLEVAHLVDGGCAAFVEWGEPDSAVTERASENYTKSMEHGIKAGEYLRGAMWLMMGTLSSLVASGAAEPLGPINSARFTLTQVDLVATERLLRKATNELQAAARDAALAEIERYTSALNELYASASNRQRRLYLGLASLRLTGSEDILAASQNSFGTVCREVLLERCGVRPGAVPTYDQTESARIVLRLLTCEAKAETIALEAAAQKK